MEPETTAISKNSKLIIVIKEIFNTGQIIIQNFLICREKLREVIERDNTARMKNIFVKEW